MTTSLSFSNQLLEEFALGNSLKKEMTKKIQFSAMSTMFFYADDHRCAETQSYSRADKKRFIRHSLREALRIKELLQLQHSATDSSNLPLPTQLASCDISQEEIVGLERLVFEDPMSICKRRKNHARVILMAQADQRKDGGNDVYKLARLSAILTRIPASQAQTRAASATIGA
eukprot:9087_1